MQRFFGAGQRVRAPFITGTCIMGGSRLSWRCVVSAVGMGAGGALAGYSAGELYNGSAICAVIGGVTGALTAAATFCRGGA
jgi:hypothetical protein